MFRETLAEMAERLQWLEERCRRYERRIELVFRQDERARRLGQIEGVGPLIATALVAAVGNAREFRSGRELAAWRGLVPRQYSSGGQRTPRDQQTRRPLSACTNDSRCAICVARRRTQARPTQHLDQSHQTTAGAKRSGSSAGQQECPGHLGPFDSRRRLPHAGGRLDTARRKRLPEVAKVVSHADDEPVRPALSKPVLKLGPLEATRVMRRKRADFHQGPERTTPLLLKAGYMAATGFSSADLQPCAASTSCVCNTRRSSMRASRSAWKRYRRIGSGNDALSMSNAARSTFLTRWGSLSGPRHRAPRSWRAFMLTSIAAAASNRAAAALATLAIALTSRAGLSPRASAHRSSSETFLARSLSAL